METVFVDPGAWEAIEDGGDRYHDAALRFKNELCAAGHASLCHKFRP